MTDLNNLLTHKLLVILVLVSVVRWSQSSSADEELEVYLEFSEYDLEDFCVQRTEAEWSYLIGRDVDLRKVKEIENKTAEFQRKEAFSLLEHKGKEFESKKLERMLELFQHPGPALLPSDNFTQYVDYALELQSKNIDSAPECEHDNEDCSKMYKTAVEKTLLQEKSEKNLLEIWNHWYSTLEESTDSQERFVDHLRLLHKEAVLNDDEDVASYWLKTSEITWINYESALRLWREIMPLYQKLRHYMAVSVARKYGRKIFIDNTYVPAHILGSLQPEDWIATSNKYEMFLYSQTYQQQVKSFKNMSHEDIYKTADSFTGDLNFGRLPGSFYKRSVFQYDKDDCFNKMTAQCKKEHDVKVVSCKNNGADWYSFVKAHEQVTKVKIWRLSSEEIEENGYLLREGIRDSVIHEAVTGLSSLLATQPANLKRQNILSSSQTSQSEELMTHLLQNALYILPKLPYYLIADLWRIKVVREIEKRVEQSLKTTPAPTTTTSTTAESDWYADFAKWTPKPTESTTERHSFFHTFDSDYDSEEDASEVVNTTAATTTTEVTPSSSTEEPVEDLGVFDFVNITKEWWDLREKLEAVSLPDSNYKPDFLGDEKIIWNRPYISTFLGTILQFQLFEFLTSGNFTDNILKLQSVLKRGKSRPWEELLSERLKIEEISTGPLVNYFKPLESFLANGADFDSLRGSKKSFIPPELQVLLSKHVNETKKETTTEMYQREKEQSAFTTTFICIAIAGFTVLILIVGIRKLRNRRRLQRKKKLRQFDQNYN